MQSHFAYRLCLVGLIIFAMAVLSGAADDQQAEASSQKEAPVNSLCYVCHIDLQSELIATVHLKEDIGCDKCHGRTTNHMHDEMLMTKPDVLIGRTEVKDLCRKCHESHKRPAKVEAFRNEWQGRRRPNGRVINDESICTDCHGTHNIIKNELADAGQKEQEWITAFNGTDLGNWDRSGSASWSVERGRIVAAPGKAGDLSTGEVYQDYMLTVTFRADWPVDAGIWLRRSQENSGPMVELSEDAKSGVFAASLRMPEQGLVLVNSHKDWIDRGGWNTISVKVLGDRVALWLNGEEIGAVRVEMPEKGSIGFHVGSANKNKESRLEIREVLIQPLSENKTQN